MVCCVFYMRYITFPYSCQINLAISTFKLLRCTIPQNGRCVDCGRRIQHTTHTEQGVNESILFVEIHIHMLKISCRTPWSATVCFEWTTAAPDQQHSVLSRRQQPLINDILFWVDGSSPWWCLIYNIPFWVDGSSPWSTTFCFQWMAAAPDDAWFTTFRSEWTTAAPDLQHSVLSGLQQPLINDILIWAGDSSSWSITFCFEWTAAAPDQRHFALNGWQHPLIHDILFWVSDNSQWSTTFCFEWTAAAPDLQYSVLSGRQQPLIYNILFWVDDSSPW
jgi:hypothetical protein